MLTGPTTPIKEHKSVIKYGGRVFSEEMINYHIAEIYAKDTIEPFNLTNEVIPKDELLKYLQTSLDNSAPPWRYIACNECGDIFIYDEAPLFIYHKPSRLPRGKRTSPYGSVRMTIMYWHDTLLKRTIDKIRPDSVTS